MPQHLIHINDYTFFLTDEINEEEDVEILILSLKKQPYPCVRIELNKNETEAYLQSVNYYTSCSINEKTLEKQQGTIVMIQTALTYMLNTYSQVKKVHLQDETFINIPGKPLITPRRLLKGELGWYEEYLGATPMLKILKSKLKMLRNPEIQTKLQSLLPPESNDNKWWIPSHIMPVAEQLKKGLFHYLIGTMWDISASTIRNYNLELRLEPVSPKQGGAYKKRIQRNLAKKPWIASFRHEAYYIA